MTLDALKKATDLNIIINNLLQKNENAPEFSKECEEKVMDSIEKYTSKVTGLLTFQLQDTINDNFEILTDCIHETNRNYYRNGMKAGAVLLMQLMGF